MLACTKFLALKAMFMTFTFKYVAPELYQPSSIPSVKILCIDCKSNQEYNQADTTSKSPNTTPQKSRRVFKDLHFDGLYLDFQNFKDYGVRIF